MNNAGFPDAKIRERMAAWPGLGRMEVINQLRCERACDARHRAVRRRTFEGANT